MKSKRLFSLSSRHTSIWTCACGCDVSVEVPDMNFEEQVFYARGHGPTSRPSYPAYKFVFEEEQPKPPEDIARWEIESPRGRLELDDEYYDAFKGWDEKTPTFLRESLVREASRHGNVLKYLQKHANKVMGAHKTLPLQILFDIRDEIMAHVGDDARVNPLGDK